MIFPQLPHSSRTEETHDSFSSAESPLSAALAWFTGSSSQKTQRRHLGGRSSRLSRVILARRRDTGRSCSRDNGRTGGPPAGPAARLRRPDPTRLSPDIVLPPPVPGQPLPFPRYRGSGGPAAGRQPAEDRYDRRVTASRKSFGSDNQAGTHEAVLRMIGEVNAGDLPAYGADPWTARATEQLRAAFGARGGIFFVFNGTAANILGLSLLVRPFEAVICAESSHLNVDECGAAERVLGSKLLPVPAPGGKLTPDLVASRLGDRGDEHRAQPRVVAIAQVTEL